MSPVGHNPLVGFISTSLCLKDAKDMLLFLKSELRIFQVSVDLIKQMTEEMPLLHAKGGELNIHNRHLDELRFFLKEAAARHEHPM
jgi:hypothetical protein